MTRGVFVALGLTLVVAESALAQGLPAVPDVQVPQVPAVPALPAAPALPAVPAVPAAPARPALPVVSNQLPAPVPNAPQPSGGTSAPSVRRAAPLGSGGRSAPVSAARGGRAAGSSTTAPAAHAVSAARRPASRAVIRRDRRLRRSVSRRRACLDGLPTLERRVLVLRSGLGPRRPRSRTRVARVLDVSAKRVGRLERRGLRRLRGLARGGCGGGRSTDGGAAAPTAGESSELGSTTALASPSLEADRVEVKGEQESGRERDRGAPGPKRAPPASSRPNLPRVVLGGEGGTDLTVPLLALATLLAIVFAGRGAIRSQRS